MDILTDDIRRRVGELGYTVGFGHLGDGNLHLHVAVYDKVKIEHTEKLLEPYLYQKIKEIKGSISAEHGIGVMKAPFLNYSKPENAIDIMKSMKKIFDPKGILNPYKIFI